MRQVLQILFPIIVKEIVSVIGKAGIVILGREAFDVLTNLLDSYFCIALQ